MEAVALSPHHASEALVESEDAPASATVAASALTPPTSEEMNSKAPDSPTSELSDLDMDDDGDEDEVVPDHYYDGGKIPVFKPTMDQFRSFKRYIDKIDKFGMKSGIVKVIPPKEWRDNLPALDELVKTIKIRNPITQEFMGAHGTYTQANIEKQRSYNLPEWKDLTEETQHQPPARRGERRRNQEKVVRGGGNIRGRKTAQPHAQDVEPAAKRRPGRPRKNPMPKQDDKSADEASTAKRTSRAQVPPTPTSPGNEEPAESVEKVDDPTPTKAKAPAKKPRGRPPKGSEQKSVASRRMNNRSEANDIIDEAAFKGFDYRMDHLDEFTAERCAELETAYWKSVTFAQPMYAADMPGSLFTDSTTSWNVAKLENLLDVLGTKVPGVNTAYLYMGMWKATFAWHLEDVDLYSINYIHFGAPKQWYSISQEDARRFEAAMRKIWPNDSKNCDQFLRHKTYLISPALLQSQFNIKVNKLVHHEGEFVITYPYGYHSGYNLGYNCAESVNFATESWLDYGRIARKCDCEADSVWVDVADVERRLRGEPTPEYYEETDDDEDEVEETGDLPSPPASVVGKTKAAGRKRKRDPKEKDANKKKKKRIRIRIKTATREPCVLCPNDAPYEPLLTTDNGRKAHRSCALYTPETWVSVENGVEQIFGVAGIDRARLDLKCNFCRSKRGACFQCASKKCTRAFHATCAAAAGVQIDAGPVPTFGEDGTEYFEEGYDFRCRFHRPKRAKNLDVDALETSKLVNNFAKAIKANDVVQIQYPGGDVFAGLVVENRFSEMSMLVQVLPEGDRVEVEWKWIVVLDPEDSLRPKPSASAIPMPEGMNKKSVSIENRQDGMPNMDDPFHDNEANKWAEFVSLEKPPHGYALGSIKNLEQVKVDLDKPDQLYYYLPKLSTEARCKFADDPNGQYPVAKADFLERAKPAQALPRSSHQAQAAQQHARIQANAAHGKQQPVPGRKPYTYKPRSHNSQDPIQLNGSQDAARRASCTPTGTAGSVLPPLRQQMSDPNAGHRAFPDDAYYSSRLLPAAFPGEYSNYTELVRKNSDSRGGGAQSQAPQVSQQSSTTSQSSGARKTGDFASFPPQQSPYAHTVQHGAAPTAPMMGAMTTGPVYPSAHRSSFDSIRPESIHAHPSSQPNAHQGYNAEGMPPATPGFASSVSGTSAHPPNAKWTPPSQVFQSHTFDQSAHPQYRTPPPASARPQAMHQTTYEFQQQIAQAARRPSVSNRYGGEERLMRDTATHPSQSYQTMTNGYAPHSMSSQNGAYTSPKAPTPSPLSEATTPYFGRSNGPYVWKAQPAASVGEKTHISPYGAPPPQQSQQGPAYPGYPSRDAGLETWRYN